MVAGERQAERGHEWGGGGWGGDLGTSKALCSAKASESSPAQYLARSGRECCRTLSVVSQLFGLRQNPHHQNICFISTGRYHPGNHLTGGQAFWGCPLRTHNQLPVINCYRSKQEVTLVVVNTIWMTAKKVSPIALITTKFFSSYWSFICPQLSIFNEYYHSPTIDC